jgi:SAM-dependent methyltransferase
LPPDETLQSSRVLTRYPSAPSWYRPVLAGRNLFIKAKLTLRTPTPPASEASDELNLMPSPLTGVLIPERLMPGSHVDASGLAYHLSRYVWALPAVGGKRAVDLGCGTGYGSYLLSWAARQVTGVDVSVGALAYARAHYPGVDYRVADLTRLDQMPEGDVAVCFEVLEHLSDPQGFMHAALAAFPRVLFSFPNPWWHNSQLNPHHVQDWPLRECKRRLHEAGATRIVVFSQMRRSHAVVSGARPRASIWVLDCSR